MLDIKFVRDHAEAVVLLPDEEDLVVLDADQVDPHLSSDEYYFVRSILSLVFCRWLFLFAFRMN